MKNFFKSLNWSSVLKYLLILTFFVVGIFTTSYQANSKIKNAKKQTENIIKIKKALQQCGCKKTYEEIIK